MVDQDLAVKYYGYPPYYRNIRTGRVETLPFRVRMPDGSTRTDPEQWSLDPTVLSAAGYIETNITQEDIDYKKPTLQNLKQIKLQKLESYWNYKIAQGWASPEGWKLGLTINDVTLLTGAFLLLKEGVNLGLISSTTIIDMDNTAHIVDLPTMTMLMLSYGQYRANLSNEYSSIKNQISEAIDENQLDAIIIGENNGGA